MNKFPNSSATLLWGPKDFELCLRRTAAHWAEWEPCFSIRTQSLREFKLLNNSALFAEFVGDFGLRWVYFRLDADAFRMSLKVNMNFKRAIQYGCSRSLDLAADELRNGAGARQLSALSKIAMFAKTDVFLPSDRWSRLGLRKLQGQSYPDYASFHDSAMDLLREDAWVEFKKFVIQHPLCPKSSAKNAFFMRAVDMALMTIGGRWSRPNLMKLRSAL